MAEETKPSQAADQAKHTYVTLTFDHPVTNEEVKQMQMQHRAFSAAHTVDLQTSRPDWYHIDNGFTSRHAMNAQHGPLVEMAHACLVGIHGHVLDLGCGNGALLQKICKEREDLIPCGVDLNIPALEHARQLFPRFARNFEHKDIFDPVIWSGTQCYALAILMAGRLKEAAPGRATALLACLTARCDRLLLYVYPSWNGESLETIIRRSGLSFEQSIAGVAGIVANDVYSP
jgi:SAM-dependent methyltransferase